MKYQKTNFTKPKSPKSFIRGKIQPQWEHWRLSHNWYFWTQASGVLIQLGQMDTNHIINALNLMRRIPHNFSYQTSTNWISNFKNELDYRYEILGDKDAIYES